MNNKHAFVTDLKTRLDKLDAELSELEARARQAGADARAAYEARLAMIRQKRQEAKQKYDVLHAAGENAWEHLKQGAEEAWTSLKVAVDKARSEFRS
jgi:cell division septum initiation protein DivIVA